MQHIGFVLKHGDERAVSLCEEIGRFVKREGRDILVEAGPVEHASSLDAAPSGNIADEADLLIAIGGDGTILRAASLINAKRVPVLGINLGRVGFMTEVSPHEAVSEVRAVLDGKGVEVERMMLEISLPDGTTRRVLNDAVIHWGHRARLIDLGLRIGDGEEIECRADGFIVCTPIGSTAYSYAASGPLVHPTTDAILVTPICPYSGLKRPLLIPPALKTELSLRRGEDLTLTLDGHTTMNLQPGDSIRISRSPVPFVMVKSKVSDYFKLLRDKLGFL
jgi:NAD+ kinase